MQRSSAKAGFTLIELIVATAVMGLLMTLTFNALWGYYDSNITSLGTTTQDTDARSSLRQIDREVSSAIGFSENATVPLGLGISITNLTWSYNSNPDKMTLITTSYATTPADSSNPGMVLYKENLLGNCANDPLVDALATYQSIYFIAANPSTGQDSLYRRTIVDPDTCSGQGVAQKTSCAASTSRTLYPACKSVDALIVDNVKWFRIKFFANPTDVTPISGSSITTASTAELSVSTQAPNAKIPESTASIRINLSKLNN